jgi:hypothetical protein
MAWDRLYRLPTSYYSCPKPPPSHNTMAARTECLACRITGTATFTGLGIYALWMSREAAPGGRGSKRIVALFGAGKPISLSVVWTRFYVFQRCLWVVYSAGDRPETLQSLHNQPHLKCDQRLNKFPVFSVRERTSRSRRAKWSP